MCLGENECNLPVLRVVRLQKWDTEYLSDIIAYIVNINCLEDYYFWQMNDFLAYIIALEILLLLLELTEEWHKSA